MKYYRPSRVIGPLRTVIERPPLRETENGEWVRVELLSCGHEVRVSVDDPQDGRVRSCPECWREGKTI